MALTTQIHRADVTSASQKRTRIHRVDVTAAPPVDFPRTRIYRTDLTAASAPTVAAGDDQTVEPFTQVTLTATASGSGTPDITWQQISGPTVTLTGTGTGAGRTFTPDRGSVDGVTRVFRATATLSGTSSTDDVSIVELPATELVYAADGSGLRAVQVLTLT